MSRRTITHSQRVLETHTAKNGTGTWQTAHYVPQAKEKVSRPPYGLFAPAGDDTYKLITLLSGRFGRAIRKAHRDGRYYPGAFMSLVTARAGKPHPTGERFRSGEAVVSHLRGQMEAQRAVSAKRTVDWDSTNPAGESLNDVLVDILRERIARNS